MLAFTLALGPFQNAAWDASILPRGRDSGRETSSHRAADLLFISTARLGIVKDRIRAPDLVIECSRRIPARQLQERLRWFAEYGVREYGCSTRWRVDSKC